MLRNLRIHENFLRYVCLASLLSLSLLGCKRVTLGGSPSPEETELAYQQGTQALEAGRYSDAIPHLDRVVEARPQDITARYNLGVALQRVHSYRSSVRALTAWGAREVETRKIAGDVRVPMEADSDYIYALGTSYQELREFDNALVCFVDASALDSKHLKSRYSRALLLQQRGKLEEARVAWKDYLQRDSSSAWAEGARKNLRKVERQIAENSGS